MDCCADCSSFCLDVNQWFLKEKHNKEGKEAKAYFEDVMFLLDSVLVWVWD